MSTNPNRISGMRFKVEPLPELPDEVSQRCSTFVNDPPHSNIFKRYPNYEISSLTCHSGYSSYFFAFTTSENPVFSCCWEGETRYTTPDGRIYPFWKIENGMISTTKSTYNSNGDFVIDPSDHSTTLIVPLVWSDFTYFDPTATPTLYYASFNP